MSYKHKEPQHKTCVYCGVDGTSEFQRHNRGRCCDHCTEEQATWGESDFFRYYKYKLHAAEYKLRLESQQYKCCLCKIKLSHNPQEGESKPVVDHNHTTGQVRGLLCFNCNIGLGNFRESITALEAAVQYLKQQETTYS